VRITNRINFTLYRLPEVLEGDLGELNEALANADVAERLAAAAGDGA
jgi:protein subunit release factor A